MTPGQPALLSALLSGARAATRPRPPGPRRHPSVVTAINRAVEDEIVGLGQAGAMDLPTGLVTFLLTDVEESTALWRTDSDRAAQLTKQIAAVTVEVVSEHGGVMPLEQGEGDSAVAAFERPDGAILAALDLQMALRDLDCRIRIGIHTGLAELVDDATYGGTAIIRTARIRDLGRGGEILVSRTTSAVAEEAVPAAAALVEVGDVELKGFDAAEPVFRLEHPDLADLGDLPVGVHRTLPSFPTSFVGRDHEQAELRDLLTSSRLVTITGAGGSGKTRLAHRVAAGASGSVCDRVVWVDLTTVSDRDLVGGRALEACGQVESTGTAPGAQLARHLANRSTLLVVDNCEHLLGPVADLVSAVLSAGGDSRVLVTSREPLGVAGEVTWRIPSLDVPAEIDESADVVGSCEAAALFVERARATSAFELDDSTAPDVARICRRLDGIPLALELAAGRVRSMTVEDLASRLDDRFALLTSGTRGVLERQRTLQASVQWSYDLLDVEEQRLLRCLSVFRAPFQLSAAESMAADADLTPVEVLDGLTRLVDKSLLQFRSGRYALLETIRAYAADRAADAGELEDLRDRHLDWAVRRVTRWGYPYDPSARGRLDEQLAESPDLMAALDWAWRRRPEDAQLLAQPLAHKWNETGSYGEAQRLIARATEVLGEGTPEWLEFMSGISLLCVAGGVIEWMGAAQVGLDQHPDIAPIVRARIEQASAALRHFVGDPGALDDLRRAGATSRVSGDEMSAFLAFAYEAFALVADSRMNEVRPIVDWLDAHGQPAGDWWAFDVVRAVLAGSDGDHATARRFIDPLVAAGLPMPCLCAGYIALHFRDLDLARAVEDAVADQTLDGWFAAAHQSSRAVVASLEGDYQRARVAFLEADPTIVDHWGYCTLVAAAIDVHLDDVTSAKDRMAAVATPIEGLDGIPEVHAMLAALESVLATREGDHATAVAEAVAALTICVDSDYRVAIASSLESLAVAMDARDPASRDAARLLGAADAFTERTGAVWFLPAFVPVPERLREHLDTESYEEGRGLGLLDAAKEALALFASRERPASGWDALTPAEQRVVALVGDGLSNPEIADTLFVGVSTVKTHLVHAYQKLHIDSRAALAAAVATRATARR